LFNAYKSLQNEKVKKYICFISSYLFIFNITLLIKHPPFSYLLVILRVIFLLMTFKHSCMVPHLSSYFWLLEFSLSLIASTPGRHQLDLTSMRPRLNMSGLVPLSGSRSLISLFSLNCYHWSLSRQVSGIWVLPWELTYLCWAHP